MSWDIQMLFRLHARDIARSLKRNGLTEDTAADITQDTFVRVLAKPPAATAGTHNPKAYLYKISRNLRLNQQKRDRLIETVDIESDAAQNLADPAPSPEAVVYSRQCLAQTHQALAELPERTRRAFEMHRLGERTLHEGAQELDISTTRAWTLIRDAYKHLLARVDEF